MALEFAGIEYKWNANERIVEEAFKQCFKSLNVCNFFEKNIIKNLKKNFHFFFVQILL